jgi:hypothetical protein
MPDKITELQAKAYRVLCQIDQLQLILRQTNQQIAELSKQPVKEDKTDDTDNSK